MMSLESRPRMAGRARLRFDRQAQQHILLYPERGLALNATAAEIVKLCTGENTVATIIDRLAARPGAPPPDVVAREVLSFLERMVDRALVETAA